MKSESRFAVISQVLALGALAVACSSKTTYVGAIDCPNDYSGRWQLSGSCTNTSCDITQTACSLSVTCDEGTKGNGTLNGNTVVVYGLLGSGDSGSCTVSFSGESFSMDCQSSAGKPPCSGTASCQSGSCGKPFPSTSSGATTVPCKQKSETDADCADQPDKPRKLECDAADTEEAIAAGCTPTSAGSSDVCCPTTVTGVTDGSPRADAGSGSTALTCHTTTSPKIFAPEPGTGPYCDTGHCSAGELCCINVSPLELSCAPSCGSGQIPIACYNSSECPSEQKCCFKAVPDTSSCSYLVARDNQGSRCSSACDADEMQACASSNDCSGGETCVAAYFANSAGTSTTSAQAGFCR